MIFLSVACDNIYRFKDFSTDFTYDRRINHVLAANDELFPSSSVKVRKNVVIIGGNASGKTTFGKLLCLITNYVYGRAIDKEDNDLHLKSIVASKEKKASFTVEFAIPTGERARVYRLAVDFSVEAVLREELRVVDVFKSYNIKKIRTLLDNAIPVHSYTSESGASEPTFSSPLFSRGIKAGDGYDYAGEMRRDSGFLFQFSEFAKGDSPKLGNDIDFLNHLLPEIDNSIKGASRLRTDDGAVKSDSYAIILKDGYTLDVPNGDLKRCEQILSHGTFEAINFVATIAYIKKHAHNITYIDEQFSHMHAELESYFIRQAILARPTGAQIFFTTHNIQALDMNIPYNAFMFFKRTADGYNVAVYASDYLNKNDRRIRSYYENDLFNVLPDYSAMDDIFEDYLS